MKRDDSLFPENGFFSEGVFDINNSLTRTKFNMATNFQAERVIVVGGGLAGFSAANTVLEHGGKVVLLDKSAFCGYV
jgi:ribulose 1,5-bisphosphate synthetase/thiazole synthase